MEEVKEDIEAKQDSKEEYILPAIESGVNLKDLISNVKKEHDEFMEELVTVSGEEKPLVKFDSETKPTILTSLVRNYNGLDVKNYEDDIKKGNIVEKNHEDESHVIEIPSKAEAEDESRVTEIPSKDEAEDEACVTEIPSKAEAEEIIKEVTVENGEFLEKESNHKGENMAVGAIDYIVNLETGETSMEYSMKHLPLENDDKCNDCGETFECKESLLEHTKKVHVKSKGPKHLCKICGMEFKYKANCRKHEKLHDDIYHFKCKYCNITFKQRLTLKNHYIYVHETEKPYKCEDCDSCFKSMNNLKAHIEVHHNITGETFSCDFCHMEFKRRCYLKRHIGIHTNPDKKFTCADCGLKCRSKTDIAKHVLTHIGVVEKRFFCEICGVGFSKQAHVVRHRRTHSVEKTFPCVLCDRAYKDQYSLKTHHETVHLGITFSCEICGFQSDRHSLKKHLKRCEGQKKFTCEICHKEYYLKKWFEQHITKCHSIQS